MSEQPRLLARASQYGYVTIDPEHPYTRGAMTKEPEPLRPEQLENLAIRREIQRAQQVAATKAEMLSGIDRLAADATGHERRRLQNAQRAVKSI